MREMSSPIESTAGWKNTHSDPFSLYAFTLNAFTLNAYTPDRSSEEPDHGSLAKKSQFDSSSSAMGL